MSYDDFEWLMGINFWGSGARDQGVPPHLLAADEGHVVNLSSVFGLISVPGQSAYNAAKFAVRGMTESLRMELKGAHSTVSCTTVHPGGVKTNIVRNGRHDETRIAPAPIPPPRFEKIARTTPDQGAQTILRRRARQATRRDRHRRGRSSTCSAGSPP